MKFATGTEFQKKVWKSLGKIPFGKTFTYQQIAQTVGTPQGFRAVGMANGANPVAILIPCHRVINASGHLGGYAGAWLYLRALERYSPARRFSERMAAPPPVSDRRLSDSLKNLNVEGLHQLSRDELNRLLDKIGAQGLGSLSPQERTFLSNFVPPDDRKRWTS